MIWKFQKKNVKLKNQNLANKKIICHKEKTLQFVEVCFSIIYLCKFLLKNGGISRSSISSLDDEAYVLLRTGSTFGFSSV